MLDMLQYEFMRKAFITGVLIAVITPCIGVVVVLRRLSMTGDSLSHNSLAGVAAGLAFGFNPVMGALVFSIGAAFAIEKIRKSFPQYSEIAIAVIMSTGIGTAGILSGSVKNSASFNSFLFGSIVAITDFELYMVVGLSVIAILAVTLLYKELFYITFDQESAKLAGVPVGTINFLFTLLTAVTISISARTVGTLVISSLMVLPVASAMQLARSYKQTVVLSVFFAVLFMISGLSISYFADLKPGGTIVIVGVLTLAAVLFCGKVARTVVFRKIAQKMNSDG